MQTLPQIAAAHKEFTKELQSRIDDALELEDLGEMQERLQVIALAELQIDNSLTHKVNGWVWVIRQLTASAQYFRSQARYFQVLAQRTEKAAESMECYLLQTLEATGNNKLNTQDFKLSICRNSAVPLEIDNNWTGDVPDQYLKARDLEDIIDKTAVKEALRSGKDVPFAKLGQPGKHIRGVK